jgi:hypothetical protein
MKKKYFFMLFTSTALFLTSCGPTQDDAVKWNDAVVNCENEVRTAIDGFLAAIDVKGADLNKECDKAIVVAEAGIVKMKALEDFKDGAEFKAAGIESLTLYQSVLKNEFKQLIALTSNPNATEEDYAKIEEHLNNTDDKIKLVDNKFTAAQKVFADKWGFTLVNK